MIGPKKKGEGKGGNEANTYTGSRGGSGVHTTGAGVPARGEMQLTLSVKAQGENNWFPDHKMFPTSMKKSIGKWRCGWQELLGGELISFAWNREQGNETKGTKKSQEGDEGKTQLDRGDRAQLKFNQKAMYVREYGEKRLGKTNERSCRKKAPADRGGSEMKADLGGPRKDFVPNVGIGKGRGNHSFPKPGGEGKEQVRNRAEE